MGRRKPGTRTETILTQWRVRTYDVWGNAKDGWEVNDVYSQGEVELGLKVKTYNQGTPQEFKSAHPTDTQIRSVLGLGRTQIDCDGDDLQIVVNRWRDGYPLAELVCVSHESLSPIREKENEGNVR